MFVVCVVCLTWFENCLVKQVAIYLGVVFILLLNVIDVLSVGEGALLGKPCIVFKECVCSTFDPSVYLDVVSIGFVCVCLK